MAAPATHVVVVGAGVTGLAAAWAIAHDHDVDRVTVLESSPGVGGKLAVTSVAGIPVDAGADVVLAHRAEATELIDAVGLARDLQAPASDRTAVLLDGALRQLPASLLSGIPTDASDVARCQLLEASALARLPLDHVLPRTELGEDIGLGRLVAERLGVQVVDRLLAPVMSAVHAGPVMELSVRATMPGLFQVMRDERSLLVAAGGLLHTGGPDEPRYLGLVGGLGRLPEALAAGIRSRGVQLRTGAVVRGLVRRRAGWRLEVVAAGAAEAVDADGVVLAVPAGAASRLLREVALGASVHLGEIRSASVATVVLAYRSAEVASPAEGLGLEQVPGGGVLLRPSDGRPVTLVTVPSTRWSWSADLADAEGLTLVRVSLGRLGEERSLQHDDDELAALAHRELAFLLRTGRATPVASAVTRWGGALPQYEVGHVDRVTAVRESLATQPALAVCGAAYDGTGIAACIASARRAAGAVAGALRASARAAR